MNSANLPSATHSKICPPTSPRLPQANRPSLSSDRSPEVAGVGAITVRSSSASGSGRFICQLAALLCCASPLVRAEPEGQPFPELKFDGTPLPAGTPTYAPIVEKVSPSVVTINTSQTTRRAESPSGLSGHPLFDDPMFRKFFGIPEDESPSGREPNAPNSPAPNSPNSRKRGQGGGGQDRREKGREKGGDDESSNQEGRDGEGSNARPRKREQVTPLGLGSGVIVSSDGYILTNNHVLEGADKIEVSLGKSGKSYPARKVGGDVRTDIAVLKIDATNLVPITFSNSDQLRAGDVVIAVGNPFGLTRSATMGVVSAVGRNSQMSQLADLGNFIQTDAAINMGNSGGALVDYLGRLVGINTAIFSRSGGNQGIGFSVPANMARSVMESLIKHGRVLRGFLGIGLQDVDEALQKEFNVEPGSGALITEVQANSPAVKAGLREYDVVTGVNGKKVEGVQDLRLTVASMLPGAKVTLQVIRDRKNMDVTVQLGEKPERREAQPVVKEADPDVLDGVTVADLDDNNRQEFKVPANIKGAMVTAVEADSIAATAGIRPGDVIQEVKRRPISSADEAVKLSEELKKEKQVLLRVYTRGGSRLLMLESKP
jgi:serine protease Do